MNVSKGFLVLREISLRELVGDDDVRHAEGERDRAAHVEREAGDQSEDHPAHVADGREQNGADPDPPVDPVILRVCDAVDDGGDDSGNPESIAEDLRAVVVGFFLM